MIRLNLQQFASGSTKGGGGGGKGRVTAAGRRFGSLTRGSHTTSRTGRGYRVSRDNDRPW